LPLSILKILLQYIPPNKVCIAEKMQSVICIYWVEFFAVW